jgi:hypothetical protein
VNKLDEEMIESLFGVTTRSTSENEVAKKSLFTPIAERNEILDLRKAHIIAMHYRALHGEDLHHIQDTITTLEVNETHNNAGSSSVVIWNPKSSKN